MLLTACVAHTADDVIQEKEPSAVINDLQVASANNAQSIEELKADVAKLHGDIEKLEHLIQQNEAAKTEALNKNNIAEAEQAQDAKLEQEAVQNVDIDEQYKLARKNHDQKNYSEAEKYYTAIVGGKSAWYDEKARFFLGQMYADSGQYKKAIIAFQEFADKYPKSKNIANAVYAQAESFLALNQKKEAEVFFKDVIQRFPRTKEASLARKRLKAL
jgi:TolA-binding protein